MIKWDFVQGIPLVSLTLEISMYVFYSLCRQLCSFDLFDVLRRQLRFQNAFTVLKKAIEF